MAYESSGSGYNGPIGVMVGVNLADNQLTGISVVSHAETPGLGARIVESQFTESFAGKDVGKELAVGDINAISGATLSTEGVVDAVNKARQTLEEHRDRMVKQGG
jgi:electron transport complex protein RnfG